MFSNEVTKDFELTRNKDGVWIQCLCAIKQCENGLNRILADNAKGLSIPIIDFSSEETLDFNDDIDHVISLLRSSLLDQTRKTQVTYIISMINEYIENEMLPLLKSLEVFIVFSAFVVDERPIIDLFFTMKNDIRTRRTPHDFAIIMSGEFMTFFYKVNGL